MAYRVILSPYSPGISQGPVLPPVAPVLVGQTREQAMAVDDVSGVQLDPKKVLKARMEELEWMRAKGVYKKISRKEAKKK